MTRNDHNKPRHPGHHAAGHDRPSRHQQHPHGEHAQETHPQHSHQHHHSHLQHSRQPQQRRAAKHAGHHRASHVAIRRQWSSLRRGVIRLLRQPFLRRMFWGATITMGLAVVAGLGLWWRLASGPIEFDVATPWLKSAIEENFGGKHTVSVGGTQLERDENGRPTLRLRDIVVRDADGAVVASAPKAEVGISGMALLHGQVRARSLNLVGAEMSVRIETNGAVTVFAGPNKRPIASASPAPMQTPEATARAKNVLQGPLRKGVADLAGLLAWIDGLGATGLDGHDLRELGLKNGNLTVDDQRNGKHWSFSRINVSLTRPQQGGLTFRVASENPNQPWVLSTAMRPLADGVRAVGLEARNVSISDILLALRFNEKEVEAELPLSASVRAEISANGSLQRLQGQIVAGRGDITDHGNDNVTVPIERADVRFNWEAQKHILVVPFQFRSGGNQFTLRAALQAPVDDGGIWQFTVTRGDAVIDPVILAEPGGSKSEAFAINRLAMRGRIDTRRQRIDLVQGDLSRVDTRPLYNIGLALTGSLDYSGKIPHLAFGVACTRMPGSVLKRIWPIFVNHPVRQWVEEHVFGGVVERVVIAGNAPLPNFRAEGPPMPDDGLSIELETTGTTLRPVDSLPEIHDADLTLRVAGRHAVVSLGRGTVNVPGGRKLNVANGVFDVPDMYPKPAPAHARFRIDGAMPAAAAALSGDTLRDNVGALILDPASTRGTVAVQTTVDLEIATKLPTKPPVYAITADLTNFAADKMLLDQKVEAPALRVIASNTGYRIKGNVKINGTPAVLEVKKQKDEDAQVEVHAKLDEAARRRLGVDFGDTVTGVIPVKVTGTMGQDPTKDRLQVDADLTPVSINGLLPGWIKPAGKPVRATYTLVKTDKSERFDNLTISGSGTNVKGSIELDNSGEIIAANLPEFGLSSGDKATLNANRGSDDVLHVTMRGDVYDGRNFVKTSLAGNRPERTKHKETDLDLDIKIGTVAGHNGETLRGLSLIMSRRGGHVRSFAMTAKIGRDTPLIGDLRLRASDNHQVVYFETKDAGALFRFTDMYPRMFGGRMWVAMDPPSADHKPQVGTLYISNFAVRGEPALQRVVAGAPGQPRGSVEFSELHADFTRVPGKMSVRDGIVRGPAVGVTVEGQIDYVKNDLHLRGTFVPFYGLNNMFGQIPIVGLFLGGGSNEGLLGITYEATGSPSAPRITVNPVSAIAPGLLRKFIPSPGAFDPDFIPQR
jgi:hypothetical protein